MALPVDPARLAALAPLGDVAQRDRGVLAPQFDRTAQQRGQHVAPPQVFRLPVPLEERVEILVVAHLVATDPAT